MNDTWKLTVLGVRGSFPTPDPAFLEFGGNTSCISVECGDALVVLDAGSGLAALGERMAQKGQRRADVLVSHLHLDHVMGLFSFPPLHDPAAEIHLYGAPEAVGELTRLIGPPLWPVGLSDGQGRVQIHAVQDGRPFSLARGAAHDMTITALKGSHPGGCYYYRLEGAGRSLVYALDCGLSGDMAARLTAFAQEAGLLIWDASFISADFKQSWGHSTWEQGLTLGRAAGVKQVLMSHYGPNYTDNFLREQERLASLASPLSRFAREGMVIEL